MALYRGETSTEICKQWFNLCSHCISPTCISVIVHLLLTACSKRSHITSNATHHSKSSHKGHKVFARVDLKLLGLCVIFFFFFASVIALGMRLMWIIGWCLSWKVNIYSGDWSVWRTIDATGHKSVIKRGLWGFDGGKCFLSVMTEFALFFSSEIKDENHYYKTGLRCGILISVVRRDMAVPS